MQSRRILAWGSIAIGILFLLSLTLYKVVDSDVWWHIKAGQIMWQTHHLITTDPFAWTRAGLPYRSTHEWLTQLFFAAVYALGGSTGIILLRILSALAVAVILLMIDVRRLWPNVLLVMAAILAMPQGLLERPQMISNVFFAAVLLIAMRMIDGAFDHANVSPNRARPSTVLRVNSGALLEKNVTRVLLGVWIGLQILWVNMHGAEALLSLVVFGALFLQRTIDAWSAGALRRGTNERRQLLQMIAAGFALLLAMFLSPNTWHTFEYLWLLQTDRTAEFIAEWSPHPWPEYLLQHGFFWIAGIAAILWTRKHIIALSAILLAFGVLSRTGSRHEVLFTIAATAVILAELRWNERWQDWMEQLEKRWLVSVPTTLIVVAGLFWLAAPTRAFLAQSNLTGLGSFSPAEGAVRFLKENNMSGRIYNTYAIGGYLLFHDLPVFLDGRNVDYGYAFLKEALDAQNDPTVWRSLERKFGFTVAVAEFSWSNHLGALAFLKDDPTWPLVYLDDNVAVYVKDTADHRALSEQFRFRFVTQAGLQDGTLTDTVPRSSWEALEVELMRAAASDPHAIHALLALAKVRASAGHFAEALVTAEEAIARAPERYEPYATAATILALQGKWEQSADLFELALARTIEGKSTMNLSAVAAVYERAGRTFTTPH